MSKTKIIFALILIASFLSCNFRQGQIPVKSIVLELPPSVSGFNNKFDQEALAILIKKALNKNAHFYLDEGLKDGGKLRLTLHLPHSSSLMIFASLLVTASKAEKEYKSFITVKVEKGSINSAALSEAFSTLLQNLYHLQSGNKVYNETHLQIVKEALEGKALDPVDVINSVSALGDTRERKAVETLAALLNKTDNLGIGNACLLALSEIGAEEAMPAVIEFAERKPPLIRRQAIIAARQIASQLAAEWLLVMGYGHEDAQVRKDALQALKEVERYLPKRDNTN